jgi:hypothetical protein
MASEQPDTTTSPALWRRWHFKAKIPRCLNACLRHSMNNVFGTTQMQFGRWATFSGRVRRSQRFRGVHNGLVELVGVGLLYLACEALVWGLSQALRPAQEHFPSSVIGMILIFISMCLLQSIWAVTGDVYERWIRSKVRYETRFRMTADIYSQG